MFNFTDEYCHVVPNIDNSISDYFGNFFGLELHNYAWIAAGFCTAVACILSFHLIYHHLRNYTQPDLQKYIIRILLMVPIYAIDSFLSFRFYWVAVYIDIIRDCYEAFVIYTFYCLVMEYMGGYNRCKEVLAKRGKFKLAFPLWCHVDPRRGVTRNLVRITLQYSVIRPVMTILAITLHSIHEYCPGNYSPYHGYIYVTLINMISVTLAMYGLVQFYTLIRKDIVQYKPMPKFLSIKFVIFLSFWQSVLVSLFVMIHGLKATTYWSTDNIATGVQDGLICFEMLLAALWHVWAFEYQSFVTDKKTNPFRSLASSFNPRDIMSDIYHSFYLDKLRHRHKRLPESEESEDSSPTELTTVSVFEEEGASAILSEDDGSSEE